MGVRMRSRRPGRRDARICADARGPVLPAIQPTWLSASLSATFQLGALAAEADATIANTASGLIRF